MIDPSNAKKKQEISGKKIAKQGGTEKTAAIPALQSQDFYMPPSGKNNTPVDFSKTTIVNELAQEPVQEIAQQQPPKRSDTLLLPEVEKNKSKKRLQRDRNFNQSQNWLWTVLAIIALLLVVGAILRTFLQ